MKSATQPRPDPSTPEAGAPKKRRTPIEKAIREVITARLALKSEFYGKMPPAGMLPEYIYPGARWTVNRGTSSEYTFELLTGRLHNYGGWIRGHEKWTGNVRYRRIAPTVEEFEKLVKVDVDDWDWTTVPAQPTPATAGERAKLADMAEKAKHDPYARVRENEHVATVRTYFHDLELRRLGKVAALKLDFDRGPERRAAVRHASDWDADDADELRVT